MEKAGIWGLWEKPSVWARPFRWESGLGSMCYQDAYGKCNGPSVSGASGLHLSALSITLGTTKAKEAPTVEVAASPLGSLGRAFQKSCLYHPSHFPWMEGNPAQTGSHTPKGRGHRCQDMVARKQRGNWGASRQGSGFRPSVGAKVTPEAPQLFSGNPSRLETSVSRHSCRTPIHTATGLSHRSPDPCGST